MAVRRLKSSTMTGIEVKSRDAPPQDEMDPIIDTSPTMRSFTSRSFTDLSQVACTAAKSPFSRSQILSAQSALAKSYRSDFTKHHDMKIQSEQMFY